MAEPLLRIHYLGHSSFVLRFANGVSVLTDYGESNSYGLASPIYEIGAFQPDVVLYSHHHPDHDRGAVFAHATVLDGQHLKEEVGIGEIVFKPVATSENERHDNTGFLVSFEDLTLLFGGDLQGDIVRLDRSEARARFQALASRPLGLLLFPIDWTRPITEEAVRFLEFMRPQMAIPMHYWSPQAKASFYSLLEEAGGEGKGRYLIEDLRRPDYTIESGRARGGVTTVIGLEPAPYPG